MSANQFNLPYKVTYEGDEADNGLHYSPAIEDLIAKTHAATQRAKPKTLVKLQRLIKKYPRIPVFRNYLTNYYHLTNQRELAYATNRKLLKDFPDYLFATVNLAAEYIEKQEYDKVPKILGKDLDLHKLCPHRKVFHIGEFESFMYVATHYLLEVGEVGKATEKIGLLATVFPESPQLDYLLEMLDELTSGGQGSGDSASTARGYDQSIQTDEPPHLNHPELWVLYEHDLTIPKEKLEALLQLPRETLIADLKAILWDSVRRVEYFSDLMEEQDEWLEEKLSFPMHAQFLLAALKAQEALPLILDCFKQGQDYLDFWYEDHVFETLPIIVYHLGGDQLDILKAFMLEPNIYYYGKGIVAQTVAEIGHYHPERLADITQWFESILQYYWDHRDDILLVDQEVVTSVTIELGNLPDRQRLVPLLKKFYDIDLIDPHMVGSYEHFVEEMGKRDATTAFHLPMDLPVLDHYQRITSTWHGYLSEEEQLAYDKDLEEEIDNIYSPEFENKTPREYVPPKPAQSTKVGRNDPCPCGSGKKYKKCCWGKDH